MSNPTEACAIAAPKMDKHLEVHKAICDIGSVVHALEGLLNRISGPVPEEAKNEKCPPSDPTLAEVLCGAPGEIHNKIDAAHHLIGRISDELF